MLRAPPTFCVYNHRYYYIIYGTTIARRNELVHTLVCTLLFSVSLSVLRNVVKFWKFYNDPPRPPGAVYR